MTNLGAKVQETRLRWFGHVMRRDEEYVGQKVMRMEVHGQRRRGRQRKRWWELVKEDLKEKRTGRGVSARQEGVETAHWQQRPYMEWEKLTEKIRHVLIPGLGLYNSSTICTNLVAYTNKRN